MLAIDIKFMTEAINQAKIGASKDEVPIGCVLVKDGKILVKAHNKKEKLNDATKHAEIVALEKAAKKLHNWYLEGITAYVTLEPCSMCAGAFINSRVERVVFGANDKKSGACGSVVNLFAKGLFNHNIAVESGILAEECGQLLSEFFRGKRTKKN